MALLVKYLCEPIASLTDHECSPLTPRGIDQAKKLAEVLREDAYDVIISSPLGRATQTAEIIAQILMVTDIHQDSDFAERGEGELEGLTKDEQIRWFPEYFDKNGEFVDVSCIPGGEPLDVSLKGCL